VEKYQPPHYLKAMIQNDLVPATKQNERQCLEFILKNPLSKTFKFDHPDIPVELGVIVFDKKNKKTVPLDIENRPSHIDSKEETLLSGCYQMATLRPGTYKMAFCTMSSFGEHIISEVISVRVED
jgi:hypothetical protein